MFPSYVCGVRYIAHHVKSRNIPPQAIESVDDVVKSIMYHYSQVDDEAERRMKEQAAAKLIPGVCSRRCMHARMLARTTIVSIHALVRFADPPPVFAVIHLVPEMACE